MLQQIWSYALASKCQTSPHNLISFIYILYCVEVDCVDVDFFQTFDMISFEVVA